MEIQRNDNLQDWHQTLEILKSYITPDTIVKKLKFYQKSKIEDNHPIELNFQTLEEAEKYFQFDYYSKIDAITMILMRGKEIKTIQIDKQKGMIATLDNNQEKKKEELKKMMDTDENIIKQDGCTYYKFEFGKIGKFDPKTLCYYIYENGKWEVSGIVETWVIDPEYDYEKIETKVEKSK